MTETAFILRGDMIRRLAGGNSTIVAGTAVVHDAAVIKGNTGKCVKIGCAMAHRTILGSGQMICGLAQCNIIIMTGCTVIGDAGVIKNTGSKSARGMTYATIFGGIYMVVRFAGRANAMARVTAVTHYIGTGVINKLFGKSPGVMAITAIGSGIRMIKS